MNLIIKLKYLICITFELTILHLISFTFFLLSLPNSLNVQLLNTKCVHVKAPIRMRNKNSV